MDARGKGIGALIEGDPGVRIESTRLTVNTKRPGKRLAYPTFLASFLENAPI
jgi:hypothetical protein